MRKIVIVGCGAVGSTFAYTVLLTGLANELVLIDINKAKAEGDALDLNHGLLLAHQMKIYAGDYPDCKDADIIVITAGAAQKDSETRLDLMQRNVFIYHNILDKILQFNRKAIILIATNPVDILTYVTVKITNLLPSQIIGSGTLLDSSRFRYLISDKIKVDPRNIHGLIVGEHGDSEVPVWSSMNISGVNQETIRRGTRFYLSEEDKQEIYNKTKNAAYEIINKKGSTYYAIALALSKVCESILDDEKSIIPVSVYLDNYKGIRDICLGIPCIIGSGGVEEIIDITLTEEEEEKLITSSDKLKEFIKGIQLPIIK
ncbi:MAG: L-lactate dehydrogenase [Vulcanibacillus sp.]